MEQSRTTFTWQQESEFTLCEEGWSYPISATICIWLGVHLNFAHADTSTQSYSHKHQLPLACMPVNAIATCEVGGGNRYLQ